MPTMAAVMSMPASVPTVATTMPAMTAAMPAVASTMPTMTAAMPAVAATVPAVAATVPTMAAAVMAVAAAMMTVSAMARITANLVNRFDHGVVLRGSVGFRGTGLAGNSLQVLALLVGEPLVLIQILFKRFERSCVAE